MKKQIIGAAAVFLLSALVIAFCSSFVIQAAMKEFSLCDDAAFVAAAFSFSNGSLFKMEETEPASVSPIKKSEAAAAEAPTQSPKKTSHDGEAYPVLETNISEGNMCFENVSVKNTTVYSPDIESLLSTALPFEIDDSRQVQVLVYHTHTCESYLDTDEGVYYDDFYPRSTDEAQNVCAVGEAIVRELKARGIGAVHDTTVHDYPSYDGSYDRSYDTVQEYLEKYPDIKVTLDIHRDSMTRDDDTKLKPTCTYNGKKAAQIMIMSGRNEDDDRFPFWEENLIFAVQLQKKCEDLYEGFTRPLYFGDFTYNMNVNNGSLLIEVGSDANTLEEATRSGEMLGNALAAVLQNQ